MVVVMLVLSSSFELWLTKKQVNRHPWSRQTNLWSTFDCVTPHQVTPVFTPARNPDINMDPRPRTLEQCLFNAADDGPALYQHWLIVWWRDWITERWLNAGAVLGQRYDGRWNIQPTLGSEWKHVRFRWKKHCLPAWGVRRWAGVVLMLGHRLWRWPIIKATPYHTDADTTRWFCARSWPLLI